MNALPIDDTATANGIAPAPTGSRLAGRLRRGLVVAALAALSSASLAGTASAASPGAFNHAACYSNNRTIVQTMDATRTSSFTEYIQLQGALVNRTTGATTYSHWFAPAGGASAQQQITWSGLARGNYDVYYRWATRWSYWSGQNTYSGWIRVTSLRTMGQQLMSGYLVLAEGRCYI